MSDPAIEAARRAWNERYDPEAFESSAEGFGFASRMTAAAREALASIRQLHAKAYLNDNMYEPAEWDCGECESPWPCATARLIYNTQELEAMK